MNQQVIGVSEFIGILNETLAFAYPTVTVEGEVSGFKINQGRWVFFDLKDEESTIGCFMPVYQLKVPLEDGMKVRVTGLPKLTKWGKFSFTAKVVELAGEGELRRALELLKQRLGREGLFAADRKRSLPKFPRVVGLITSAQSAAYADFIKILGARWGGVRVVLADVQVQGAPAADQIVGALAHFNQMSPSADVLVLIRGGGSLEDLQAFNTESVARAVAASRTPVIVGVGHETDESLADFAADVRAATPTDAARLVVPDRAEVNRTIENYSRVLDSQFERYRREAVQKMHYYVLASSRFIAQPRQRIEAAQLELKRAVLAVGRRVERLAELARLAESRLRQAQEARIRRQRLELDGAIRGLSGFSPTATLKRGYAIVRHEKRVVRVPNQVKAGDRLVIQLAGGNLGATTNESTKPE